MTFFLFPWTPNYFGIEVYSKRKKKKKKLPKRCVCVCVGEGWGGGGGKFFPFRGVFITEEMSKAFQRVASPECISIPFKYKVLTPTQV